MPVRRTVILAAVLALLAPAAARAEVTLDLGSRQFGHVHLVATSTSPDVRIVEDVDGTEVEVAAGPEASVPYTCDQSRTFVAIAGAERTVPLTVSTPSCADRVKVSTLEAVDVGDDLRVSIVDRWHLGGLDVDVCVVQPDFARHCRPVSMAQGQYVSHLLYAARPAGTWSIEATTTEGTVFHSLRVVRRHYPGGGPDVLFTGDSMMLATRHVLARRLPRRARAIDDIYVGSGVTRPFVIDWGRLPARQVRIYRPDATVISLGMGDSRGIGDAPCCGEDWIAAYAAQVGAMMTAYERGGQGAVVWLNLPFSDDPQLWPAEAAVNAAVARAAAGHLRVRIIDMAARLTPDGAFHRYLVRDGERIRVRTADGIHLTHAGARIASRLVMRRLRSLGVLG